MNRYRMIITIPKNNTVNFITKIKTFGIVVDENKHSNDAAGYFDNIEMRLENIKTMLEKYKGLLQDSITISDKIMLEKEINSAETEIETMERSKNEMKSRFEYNTITLVMYNK
nr:DUF4349 domain-containing protein [Treponema primitia]